MRRTIAEVQVEAAAPDPEAPARWVVTPDHPADAVDLYWLPLGAGAQVVRRCGRVYEALVAARQHRERFDLYHAALEVHLDGVRYVIESAPVWDRPEPDRGVVAVGSVGLRWLGRSKWFRYEVRRWRDGLIPDVAYAVDGPRRLSSERRRASDVLDLAPALPVLTWGRDELGTGDMWNSNSMVAWLLAGSGHDIDRIRPPAGGRAPGWRAGIVAARRGADRAARSSDGRRSIRLPDVGTEPPARWFRAVRPSPGARRTRVRWPPVRQR